MSQCIEITCDGGAAQGFGHLRRSQALAFGLKKHGFAVRVRRVSREAQEVLLDYPNDPGPAHLVLFDLPDSSEEELPVTGPLPVVALDYFGDKQPTLTISVRERQTIPAGVRLSGFSYAIIRDEITKHCPSPGGEGVLVMMGGADPRGYSTAVVERLLSLGEEVSLVVGPFAQCSLVSGDKLHVFHDPLDLAERMARCRFAVASAGVSLTEFLCLGKAVHVMPQSEAEEALASELLMQEAVLGMGLETLLRPTTERLATTRKKARTVVDGKGIDRIATHLKELLS